MNFAIFITRSIEFGHKNHLTYFCRDFSRAFPQQLLLISFFAGFSVTHFCFAQFYKLFPKFITFQISVSDHGATDLASNSMRVWCQKIARPLHWKRIEIKVSCKSDTNQSFKKRLSAIWRNIFQSTLWKFALTLMYLNLISSVELCYGATLWVNCSNQIQQKYLLHTLSSTHIISLLTTTFFFLIKEISKLFLFSIFSSFAGIIWKGFLFSFRFT